MDVKKSVGIGILAVAVVAVGFLVVRQVRSLDGVSGQPMGLGALPRNTSSTSTQITSETGDVSMRNTREPASVDAIIDDMGREANADQAALINEAVGESATVMQDSQSLNDVSQFYDDKSL